MFEAFEGARGIVAGTSGAAGVVYGLWGDGWGVLRWAGGGAVNSRQAGW